MADQDPAPNYDNDPLPKGLTLIPTEGPQGPTGGVGPPGPPAVDKEGFKKEPLPKGLTEIPTGNAPGAGVLMNPGGDLPTNQGFIGPNANVPTPPEQKSASGFLENAVSSGANFLKNAALAIVPLDAANVNDAIPLKRASDNLYDLFSGAGRWAARKLTPDRDLPSDPANERSDQAVQAFRSYVLDRYGSWDKFKDTLYKDPVGVGADLSALAGVGEASVGKLGQLAGIEAPAQALAKVGRVTNPMFLPSKVGEFALGRVMPKAAAPPAASAAPAAPALSPQEIQDAIRKRAYDLSQLRISGDPTSDWLQAEQEIKSPPQPAAQPAAPTTPPPATSPNSPIFKTVLKHVVNAGIGGAVGELLTHHLLGAALGGGVGVTALRALPDVLRSPEAQRMLSAIGPGTKPARIAATAQRLMPLLNAASQMQQRQQGPITIQQSSAYDPATGTYTVRAKGGMVNPELARIQRERLRLPGILETLEKRK